MKVDHELSNSTVISIIEEKLLKAIRRDWYRKINEEGSKVEESNKSPSLLNFFLEQKQILKNDSADLDLVVHLHRDRHIISRKRMKKRKLIQYILKEHLLDV